MATGDGIRRIFHSLGVQHIVTGGQSMNPSTAQLLEAVEAAPADEVVILPNNKNIIAVAEQVDELTTKTVRVVPTKGIAEGFAALLEYDPQAPVRRQRRGDDTRRGAGRIVRARSPGRCAIHRASMSAPSVRATTSASTATASGRWRPPSTTRPSACSTRLVGDEHEIVTIIEGEGSGAGTTRRITEWLADHRPGVTAEVHHGGQPLYPYLFGIE